MGSRVSSHQHLIGARLFCNPVPPLCRGLLYFQFYSRIATPSAVGQEYGRQHCIDGKGADLLIKEMTHRQVVHPVQRQIAYDHCAVHMQDLSNLPLGIFMDLT